LISKANATNVNGNRAWDHVPRHEAGRKTGWQRAGDRDGDGDGDGDQRVQGIGGACNS